MKTSEHRLEEARAQKQQREKSHKVQRATTYPEDAPRWPAVDLQHLVQRPIKRGVVITELLPQLLLCLSLDKMGGRRVDALPPPLRARCQTT
jgi:hypothetical protein